jgi:predicted N-acetyltransferase YhbS
LGVVEYRAERPEEFPAIGEMLTRIMRPETAALVDRIREGDRYLADLSRVAVADDGHVIRFVMLSRLDVIGEPSRTIAKSDRGVGSTEARPLGRLAIR